MDESPARRTISFNYRYHGQQIAAIAKLEEVLTDLGLIDADCYLNFNTGETVNGEFKPDQPYIVIEPHLVAGIGIFMRPSEEYQGQLMPTMEVTEVGLALADIARLMLPKCGTFTKSFDEQNNLLQLHMYYKGVHIIVQDIPPKTCTVEKVEEEVDVPEKVVPAHKEKKVSYKLVGDCEPLLAGGGE